MTFKGLSSSQSGLKKLPVDAEAQKDGGMDLVL